MSIDFGGDTHRIWPGTPTGRGRDNSASCGERMNRASIPNLPQSRARGKSTADFMLCVLRATARLGRVEG